MYLHVVCCLTHGSMHSWLLPSLVSRRCDSRFDLVCFPIFPSSVKSLILFTAWLNLCLFIFCDVFVPLPGGVWLNKGSYTAMYPAFTFPTWQPVLFHEHRWDSSCVGRKCMNLWCAFLSLSYCETVCNSHTEIWGGEPFSSAHRSSLYIV